MLFRSQAKSVGKTLAEYKKSINPKQIDYITNDIIITKMFDLLKSKNEMYTENGSKPAAKKTAAKAASEKSEKPAEKPAAKKPATAKKPAAKKE